MKASICLKFCKKTKEYSHIFETDPYILQEIHTDKIRTLIFADNVSPYGIRVGDIWKVYRNRHEIHIPWSYDEHLIIKVDRVDKVDNKYVVTFTLLGKEE